MPGFGYMGVQPTTVPERRCDLRVLPPGRVRVTLPTPGLPFKGRLVDVSAGGLRLECEDGRPEKGLAVTLEILLEDPGRPSGPPRLVLDGRGHVVWVRTFPGEGTHAGVEFEAPVGVRPSFPQVNVF